MLRVMQFQLNGYSNEAARVLELAEAGTHQMGLTRSGCMFPEALAALKRAKPESVFAGSQAPEAALSGLYLYLGCAEEAHAIAQDADSADGNYWHAILHRQEPDAVNAKYWFERVGLHPIYPALCENARTVGYDAGEEWDPDAFVDFCESARRRSGSEEETVAKQIQLVEWQLLFDWCARPAAEAAR